MLKNLRSWITARLSRGEQPNQAPGRESMRDGLESRASLVLVLQAEVRKLQQDISDLNSAWESGADQSDREDATARLRSIEKALEQKQEELSKIQGRI